MDTIEQLKQDAREREAERMTERKRQEVQAHIDAERSERELRALLAAESPLGSEATIQLRIGKNWNGDRKTIVTFQLPFHADIQATYARNLNGHFDKDTDRWIPGPWHHEGFDKAEQYQEHSYNSPDKKRQWRIAEWNGTEYDPETETYAPAFRQLYFENLGDALLAAERAFVAQEDIDREVKDMNARQVAKVEAKSDEPEITTGAQLLALLKQFVAETCGYSAPGE